MTKRTIVNKESIRREIAADLGIKIDDDDPLLLAAHIAALVTRDTIAQERAHNVDNQLLSFGDVRNVMTEARDEAIVMSKQLLGIVFMQVKEEGMEFAAQLLNQRGHGEIRRKTIISFGTGFIAGSLLAGLWFSISL